MRLGILVILCIAIASGIGRAALAVSRTAYDPPLPAPGGNISQPILTGPEAQTKLGGLSLGDKLLVREANDGTVTAPKFCIANSCIDSWDNGVFLFRNPADAPTNPQQGAAHLSASGTQQAAFFGKVPIGQASFVAGIAGIAATANAAGSDHPMSVGVLGQALLNETAAFGVLGCSDVGCNAPPQNNVYAGYFRGNLGVALPTGAKAFLADAGSDLGLVNVGGGAVIYTDAWQYLTLGFDDDGGENIIDATSAPPFDQFDATEPERLLGANDVPDTLHRPPYDARWDTVVEPIDIPANHTYAVFQYESPCLPGAGDCSSLHGESLEWYGMGVALDQTCTELTVSLYEVDGNADALPDDPMQPLGQALFNLDWFVGGDGAQTNNVTLTVTVPPGFSLTPVGPLDWTQIGTSRSYTKNLGTQSRGAFGTEQVTLIPPNSPALLNGTMVVTSASIRSDNYGPATDTELTEMQSVLSPQVLNYWHNRPPFEPEEYRTVGKLEKLFEQNRPCGAGMGGVKLIAAGDGSVDGTIDIALNVPGSEVLRAYLVWKEDDIDRKVSVSVDGGPPETYSAPDVLMMGDNRDGFVADITGQVELGLHTYRVSGYTAATPEENEGAGLIVAYLDPTTTLGTHAEILVGLDSVYGRLPFGSATVPGTLEGQWSAPYRATFPPLPDPRTATAYFLVGNSEPGNDRPDNLLWKTGAGAALKINETRGQPIAFGGTVAAEGGIWLNGIYQNRWIPSSVVIWGESGTAPYETSLYPLNVTGDRSLLLGSSSQTTAPFRAEVSSVGGANARLTVKGGIKLDQYVVGDPAAGLSHTITCGDGVCNGSEIPGPNDTAPRCNKDCGIARCAPPAVSPGVAAGIDAFDLPVVALGPLGTTGMSCYQGTKVQRYMSTCALAPAADPSDPVATVVYNANDNVFFDYNVSEGTTYCYRIWTHNDVPEYRATPSQFEIRVPINGELNDDIATCADGINNSAGTCSAMNLNACCYDYFTTAPQGCKSITFGEPTGSGSGECMGISPPNCGNGSCDWAQGETKRNCADCIQVACQSDFGLTPVCEQEEQALDPGAKFYCPGDCIEFGI